MPQYVYKCRDLMGKSHRGTLVSQDKLSAVEELRRRNWLVIQLQERKDSIFTKDIYIGNPVKNEHFVVYCRQFATLMRAGISIVDATRILSDQTESKPLRLALSDVAQKLRQGESFSQSASEHRKIFPPIFVNMMKAGEETGNMDETLERLAVFFEKEHYTREKVKSAMTYPAVISVLTIVVVGFLLKFVVPRFEVMFKDMGEDLPPITRLVLAVSRSVEHQWYIWILGILALVVLFQLFRKSERGGYLLDNMKLYIPVFGKLNQKNAMAQMSRTLSSLYASSVPVLQSLAIVEKVIGNKVIGSYLKQSQDSLRKGLPLSEPLKKAKVFPPLVTQMIAIGEETGSLDVMLSKIADFYERDVENTVDRLKSLLEPLMIVILSLVVGVIIASILMPMFSLYENISKM